MHRISFWVSQTKKGGKDRTGQTDAIAAEATPNTEMTLMVDLDLDLLKELRQQENVRNLENRRKDLYKIVWLK